MAAGLLGVALLAGCSADFTDTTASTPAPPPAAAPPATAAPPAVVAPPAPALPLAGRTVVLDPGHNGGNATHVREIARLVPAGGFRKPCNTTGTATTSGYAEHALAWDVTLRAAALLREQGATVVLTHDTDTGVGPCVDQRAAAANAAQADAALSVHADGAASGRGFHVIAPLVAPDGGNVGMLAASGRLATAVRDGFAAGAGVPYATYVGSAGLDRRADLAGLNLARVPAVMIEMGNMRDRIDAGLMTDPAWRQQAAQGLADGLAAFLTDPA